MDERASAIARRSAPRRRTVGHARRAADDRRLHVILFRREEGERARQKLQGDRLQSEQKLRNLENLLSNEQNENVKVRRVSSETIVPFDDSLQGKARAKGSRR